MALPMLADVERHCGGVVPLDALALRIEQRQVGHAVGIAEIGGTPIPHGSLAGVELDTLAPFVEPAQVNHAGRVAEVGGPLVPKGGFDGITSNPLRAVVHRGEV